MKKVIIGLVAASMLLCTNAMAGEQTLSNPDGFSPAQTINPDLVAPIAKTVIQDDLIVLSEQDGDILLMAKQEGNNYSPMLMATLAKDDYCLLAKEGGDAAPVLIAEHIGDLRKPILLAYIGGVGGAPLSKTGVSSTETI